MSGADPAGRGPDPAALYGDPNALAPHYSRFRVSERILLTGHSHQAWPDVGFEGQKNAWWHAAEYVDAKWEHAFERAERVRRGFRRLLGEADGGAAGHVVLGANTHELVIRFLSALPLQDRPRLVVTDGEFHTIRRQVDRLAEEGLEVERVPARPAEEVGSRLAAAVDGRTSAVLVSAVFYEDAYRAGGLEEALRACAAAGAELLVDVYHALNAVPFDLADEGLRDAWVVGGGYKYCQLGEGNCFLRFPSDREPRPVITGWFAEFAELHEPASEGVAYGEGAERLAGASYDPTSHYRAAAVFEFFEEQGLEPQLLREVSRHQVGLLARRFDALDLDPAVVDRDRTVPLERVGGFLTLRSPHAAALRRDLRRRGVATDHRADALRLGPAPYLSDRQLEDAIAALGEAAAGLTGRSPRI